MNMDEAGEFSAGLPTGSIARLDQIIEKEDDDQTSFKSDSDFGESRMQSHRILVGSHKVTDPKAGPSHENGNGN